MVKHDDYEISCGFLVHTPRKGLLIHQINPSVFGVFTLVPLVVSRFSTHTLETLP